MEKQIKIIKKDGTFHIVPASQRSTYEAFNTKNTKLKQLKDVVEIEDYEAPAAEDKIADLTPATTGFQSATPPPPPPPANDKKPAVEIVELISKATTIEEVNSLVAGDGRVSVIRAAESKIADLT